jgi:hypothetical protein
MGTMRLWLQRRPLWQKVFLALLGILLLLMVLTAATPQGRTVFSAALFVTQVVPAIPVKPLEWFTRPSVHERVLPEESGLEGMVDLYRPRGDGPYPAVLLFLGAAPAGPDDPRVANLGDALARSGLVTMFYWSPGKLNLRIHPPDIHNLVSAYQLLQEQPYVDPDRVGMGGFCVGASFTLMAASQEEVRDHVTFVNAFGPYFDMVDLMRAIASESRFLDGQVRHWEVDWLALTVYENQLVATLDESEGQLVRRALTLRDDPALELLSPQGFAVYRLLTGVPLDEVDEVISRLPPPVLEEMAVVSPRTHIQGLRAKVLVMHDREDALVPSEESRRLVAALDPGIEVRHTEFSLFQHVDPTRPVGPLTLAMEAGKLASHMYAVFRVASTGR